MEAKRHEKTTQIRKIIQQQYKNNLDKLKIIFHVRNKIMEMDKEEKKTRYEPRKRKGRAKALLTDDEIREDLDKIFGRSAEEKKYLRESIRINGTDYIIGESVKIKTTEGAVYGEINGIGSGELSIKRKNKENKIISVSSIRNGKFQISKVK